MIRLFSARENIDKEAFIYDNIADEALVIVPNQYTLVAEEQALHYLGTNCLFNVEILSMNRLGLRILTEQGLESVDMLDQYGRFMLLSRIIRSHKDELTLFANSATKMSFANMVNDFISEFKQQNCTMQEIEEMLDSVDADELLKNKLTELEGIVEEYEKSIEGKYTDSEDYIAMYVDAIKESKLVLGKDIWIYGYDNITPKFMNAMFELAKRSGSVNFIVNKSDFGLDDSIVEAVRAGAIEKGIELRYEDISADYVLDKSETISRIERGLFCDELPLTERQSNEGFVPEDLTIVRAANPYYEAESAACYVYHLIRDLGYKMRDIQLIANDESVMQEIVRRTFEEYGLPLFKDQSRNITDTAAVNFIVNQLWFIRYGMKTDALMAMLKTGLASVDRDKIEKLENYARTYHIKGSMWLRPFKYGEKALGDDWAMLEELRQQLMAPMQHLEKMMQGSVAEFIDNYRAYLEDEWQLSDRIREAADEQVAHGYVDEAQRNIESYTAALELFEQIKGIMGDEALDINDFIDVYMTGLTNVEVGVIPPTADGLSMGTMIRTRPRAARAVIILGANEGTLPLQPAAEGLFSADEMSYFREKGFALGALDDIKMTEEQVAMYRMMSRPSEKLYISYSMTDADGKEAAASSVIDALVELFPRIERDKLIRKDVISAGWSKEIVNSKDEAVRHLFNHMKDKNADAKMDSLTESLLSWYEKNEKNELDSMLRLAKDENDPQPLGRDMATGLYAKSDNSFRLSASSIAAYFDCPFRYYVERGLRPEEEREFSGDARSIGDVYHAFMMIVAGNIMRDSAYAEKLKSCDDETLSAMVGKVLDQIAEKYRDGVFCSDESEVYRMSRIKEVCAVAARAMAMQLTEENVTGAKFEEGFGIGRTFQPVELEVNGAKFYIEGQIDRVDFLDQSSARVVDYKTGKDKYDANKMAAGYKMQLMIYMMSVVKDGYEPAGMFYFNIEDPMQSFNDSDENKVGRSGVSKMDEPLSNSFRLKGATVSKEEYESLRDSVESRITEIADSISEGKIGIHPFKNNGVLVCNFCDYKAICRRDRSFTRNTAREIDKK